MHASQCILGHQPRPGFSNRYSACIRLRARQVDFALNTAGISPEAHGEHLKTFESARAEYFAWIEKTVESIKGKLNPYPYVQVWAQRARALFPRTAHHVLRRQGG